MRRVVPDPADRIRRHEAVDVNRAGAFERDSIEFLILEHYVLAVLALIAFDLVFVIDRLAGLGVDIAGMGNAVARRAVERVEAYFLGLGSGGSIATGQVTSDSFKYPCQEGRGDIAGLLTSITNGLPVFAVPDQA